MLVERGVTTGGAIATLPAVPLARRGCFRMVDKTETRIVAAVSALFQVIPRIHLDDLFDANGNAEAETGTSSDQVAASHQRISPARVHS